MKVLSNQSRVSFSQDNEKLGKFLFGLSRIPECDSGENKGSEKCEKNEEKQTIRELGSKLQEELSTKMAEKTLEKIREPNSRYFEEMPHEEFVNLANYVGEKIGARGQIQFITINNDRGKTMNITFKSGGHLEINLDEGTVFESGVADIMDTRFAPDITLPFNSPIVQKVITEGGQLSDYTE